MLETLAGRLKWERTEDSIRVEIPAHLSEKRGLNSISLGIMWLWIIGEDLFRWIVRDQPERPLHWSYVVAFLSIPFLILCWWLWLILTSTRLVLNVDLLTIEYRVFGFCWLSIRFPTRLLHNPRFRGKNTRTPSFMRRSPELQIDRDYRTRVLAVGVDQAEAEAVIARMMEVYPFPKYLPNESAAGVQAN